MRLPRLNIKWIGTGLSKMLSKMGVSTYMSYCGAQLFEAIGINTETINKYFTGTPSRVGGIRVRNRRRSLPHAHGRLW